jgi:branched-chain amino acid transport system substrate-binding protein
MFKRIVFTLLLVAGILLPACQSREAVFECEDAIGCVEIPPDEPLKLGVLQALSGGPASLGQTHSRAIELAISQRDNQLLGYPIELQIEDSKCTSEGGANAALRVVADPQVVGILGTSCSGAAVAASPIVSEAGLVMISGSATNETLTGVSGERGANWHPGFFRTSFNGSMEYFTAANFAFHELGVTKAATINDGDAFTKGLTDSFGQLFGEMGGEHVVDITIDKGDENMVPALESVANSGAEFLFFPLFQPEGNFIVIQVQEVDGLQDIVLMSSATLLTEEFFNNVGEHGLGMYFVGLDEPNNQASEELHAAYEAEYGEPSPSGTFANGYDATNLLLNAIETTAVQDEDGTLHIGRQALRDALHATSGLTGATGPLSCDEFGDCAVSRFNVLRFDDLGAGLAGVEANIVYSYATGEE